MRLSQILFPNEITTYGFSDIEFGKPCADSRKLQKNDVFFSENSTSYIKEAVKMGTKVTIASAKYSIKDILSGKAKATRIGVR